VPDHTSFPARIGLACRGWLRARFKLLIIRACSVQLDIDLPHADTGKEIVVDIRESSIAERHIEQVQLLYREGVLVTAIGEQLGIDRHQVTEAIRNWSERNGEAPPEDGRVRRGKVKDKTLAPPLFQRIADEAKALLDDDLLIEQIAARLGRCRDTVQDALRHWFESRGQEMPDMRHRRKTLKIKNRPKE
jgi:transposase